MGAGGTKSATAGADVIADLDGPDDDAVKVVEGMADTEKIPLHPLCSCKKFRKRT